MADDALVQPLFKVDEPLRLLLEQPVGGDSRPRRHQRCDVVRLHGEVGYVLAQESITRRAELLLKAQSLRLASRGRLEVVALLRSLLLVLEAANFALLLAQFRRQAFDVQAEFGRRLIDEVDCLVWQVAVGDVARTQACGGNERVVGERDAVVRLESRTQPAQYRDGVLYGRLLEPNRLEAALKRGVLFDVAPVLVGGGRADNLHLAAREGWLHDVGRIDTALRASRADDGVQFIDEEDDFALRLLDLVDERAQPLFELAPKLGTCDKARHIEG